MRIRDLFRHTVLSLVFLTAPLSALADLQAGAEAIHRGDFAKAFTTWLPLAQQGEVAAQAAIGVMYHIGQGVQQDYAKAAEWYRRAAEKGNAASQADLGVMYTKGAGVERDLVMAYVWYDLAAQKGEKRHARGRDRIARELNAEQLAKARRLSKAYGKKYVDPFRSDAARP